MGGEFNRWLNITRTNIIQGAQDVNQGNYTCEVCIGRGVLPEPICHTAVSTLLIIGGPPSISLKGTGKLFCKSEKCKVYISSYFSLVQDNFTCGIHGWEEGAIASTLEI